MNYRKMTKSCFTLMELLVVILILGLLAGIGVPKVIDSLKMAQWDTGAQQTKTLRKTIESYYLDKSKYPDSLEDLLEKDSLGGRYFSENYIPKDPWGNEYQYQKPGADNPFDIIFNGADGTSGGEGINKDATCWDDLNKKD